jgi:hypothetical protein
MEHEKSDRMVVDEMVAKLSAEDRADLERADREHRWRITPETLHVNGATGEMISPSGQIDGDTIAEMESRYAASVARNREKFSERPDC